MIELAVAATFAKGMTEEQFEPRPARRPPQPAVRPVEPRSTVRPAAARRPRWLRGLARFAS